MDKWVVFAVISMVFAGITAVIGKLGLNGISAELGLTIRTLFVAIFVLAFAIAYVSPQELHNLTRQNYMWLSLSAAAAAISWIFYYKAIKLGQVSVVAMIDKGSFVVAVAMAWLILREPMTMRLMFGCALIGIGLVVASRR